MPIIILIIIGMGVTLKCLYSLGSCNNGLWCHQNWIKKEIEREKKYGNMHHVYLAKKAMQIWFIILSNLIKVKIEREEKQNHAPCTFVVKVHAIISLEFIRISSKIWIEKYGSMSSAFLTLWLNWNHGGLSPGLFMVAYIMQPSVLEVFRVVNANISLEDGV